MKTCDDGMLGCLEFVCPGAVSRPYADTYGGVPVFGSYRLIDIYSFEDWDRYRRVELIRGRGGGRTWSQSSWNESSETLRGLRRLW